MRTSEEPNKVYIVGKVLMGGYSKMYFLLNLSNCVKSYGHLCQFYETAHQIWSWHVTLASNFESSYPLPNSVLNFKKSYQIWAQLA